MSGSYHISSMPGKRGGSHTKSKDGVHYGIDMAAPKGTPVYAATDGTVKVVHSSGGYGLHIIETSGPHKIYYGHLSKTTVSSGTTVQQGQKIGEVGSTGNSTGPHLHFEVRDTTKGSSRASQFVWPSELREMGMDI